jgi:hypothetical protein
MLLAEGMICRLRDGRVRTAPCRHYTYANIRVKLPFLHKLCAFYKFFRHTKIMLRNIDSSLGSPFCLFRPKLMDRHSSEVCPRCSARRRTGSLLRNTNRKIHRGASMSSYTVSFEHLYVFNKEAKRLLRLLKMT